MKDTKEGGINNILMNMQCSFFLLLQKCAFLCLAASICAIFPSDSEFNTLIARTYIADFRIDGKLEHSRTLKTLKIVVNAAKL